jgi:ABC-type multidrug transport system fused ATPase/permease subunit
VTGADRIVVLEEGAVRAVGTHAEPAGAGELYRDLVVAQFSGDRNPAV